MALLLKNLLFTVLVPGNVAVVFPLLITQGSVTPPHWATPLGALLLVLGASIYGWCVWDFATFGRGTPAPIDAPEKLVVRGLYRWSRNPMYVGVLSTILGWAGLFADLRLLLYALLVGALFHCQIIFYEEPKLRSLFGAEYDAYRSKVGRWFSRPGSGASRDG